MLREMSFAEFQDWQQFAELEPFGEERADIRTASIVSTLANIWRDPKKHRQPYQMSDFFFRFGDSPEEKKQPQSWEQMKNIGMMMAKAYGATFRKAA